MKTAMCFGAPAPRSAHDGMDLVSMTGRECIWSTSKETMEASIVTDKDAMYSFILIATNISHLNGQDGFFKS